tara:strand:+ start:912 stop:1145 length:234 start_codon:yes stop_codon:yes gene_type:complete
MATPSEQPTSSTTLLTTPKVVKLSWIVELSWNASQMPFAQMPPPVVARAQWRREGAATVATVMGAVDSPLKPLQPRR